MHPTHNAPLPVRYCTHCRHVRYSGTGAGGTRVLSLLLDSRKEGAVPVGAWAVGRGRCRSVTVGRGRCRSVGRAVRGVLLRGGGRGGVGPRGVLQVVHRGHRRFPQQVEKCFLRISQDGCSCSGVPPTFLRSHCPTSKRVLSKPDRQVEGNLALHETVLKTPFSAIGSIVSGLSVQCPICRPCLRDMFRLLADIR